MTFFYQQIFQSNFFGLDQDLDWIRIKQQVGSGSGFSKISGFVSGFSEYGSETFVIQNQAVVDPVEADAKDLDQYRM
jgi:hypothetical protein